jgi:hypothetical protein
MIPETTKTPEAMTKAQLAALYKVCVKTLNKWLEPFAAEIGDKPNTYIYTPAQIKTIYEKLGEP